ncbi:MAG: lipoyl synthase [Phycisphaerales bacterium]|nr:lipoyl synthase [Phycisphaerales bacterium]
MSATTPQAPDRTSAPLARTLARHPRPLGGDTARHLDPPALSLTSMVLNNQPAPFSREPIGERSHTHSAPSTQHLLLRRKPDWIRARMPGGPGYLRLKQIIDDHRLHTVCEEATCPNIGECWARGTATIMILGDTCTRSCGFCNVKTGRPLPADPDEPRRVADSLALMNLKHVVITCVDRDDLPDAGAQIWADTIRRVHQACPQTSVEALIGDFKGDPAALQLVIDAQPEILAHNMETVKRMHPAVRPQANYRRSLAVLKQIKDSGLVSKSGIMVGIGEHDHEVLAVMNDVRTFADTDIFTIGQYLQPTRNHLPIDRWVTPDQFLEFKKEGLALGFKVVESGPLVRSSYHAEEQADRLSPDRRETVQMMESLLAKTPRLAASR